MKANTAAAAEEDLNGLPALPYLKPWYRIARGEERLVLEYAHSTVVFEGKAAGLLLPVLLPLLDGTRGIEDIRREIGDAAAPAVTQALRMLDARGVLTDGPPLPPETPQLAADTAHFLAARGDHESVTAGREALERSSVVIVGAGTVAEEIGELLRSAGVGAVTGADWPGDGDRAGQSDLTVVTPEPDELPRLGQFNRRAVEARLPWLQVLPFDGRIAAVGPLYVPDETCCFECFTRRRAANLTYPDEDYSALQQVPASYPSPPPIRSMAAGLAAMLSLQWLSDRARGVPSGVPAVMHALGWGQTVELDSHPVYRVPRCPVCFPDDRGTASPWHG